MIENTEGQSTPTVKELVENTLEFASRMNLKVIDARPRYVKIWAPLQGNENHIGTMYAGALFTVAEIPGGALCLATFDSSRYYPLVRTMSIRFIRPACTNVTIECSISMAKAERIQAAVEEYGKADFVITGHVTDESGDVVAISKGLYQLRAIDP